jgi:cellulose biosynthesis protein BcsQ
MNPIAFLPEPDFSQAGRILAVCAGKGGAGVTSLTRALARCAAQSAPTLLVDLSEQADLSFLYGIYPEESAERLLGTQVLEPFNPTRARALPRFLFPAEENVWLFPADQHRVWLTGQQMSFEWYFLLKQLLAPLRHSFPTIWLDVSACPELVRRSGMFAADQWVVPLVPEPFTRYALEGVGKMIHTVTSRVPLPLSVHVVGTPEQKQAVGDVTWASHSFHIMDAVLPDRTREGDVDPASVAGLLEELLRFPLPTPENADAA